MFTGIVAEIGAVRHVGPNASGLRLEIASSRVAQDLAVDASVNVAGACLTVVERDTHGFAVDVVAETLSRATRGRAIRGTRVNRDADDGARWPLRAGSRRRDDQTGRPPRGGRWRGAPPFRRAEGPRPLHRDE